MMIVACQSKLLQQRFETTVQLEHQDGIGPQKRMVTNGNDRQIGQFSNRLMHRR